MMQFCSLQLENVGRILNWRGPFKHKSLHNKQSPLPQYNINNNIMPNAYTKVTISFVKFSKKLLK